MLHKQISIGEVTELDGSRFRIRLELGTPENTLSQTQIVEAGGRDAAIELANQAFQRYLEKIGYVLKTINFGCHKPN